MTSKYIGVKSNANPLFQTKKPWAARILINGKMKTQSFETEREAAIQYDKWVLEYCLDRTLNILKPVAK